MLRHTQKIKELYEGIQRHIYSMIPEKWESLYLYASVIEGQKETGELYFYYVPKGILKKKPVNVYEIPSKFNIDETEYLKLVDALYSKIKELRKEFKRLELGETWSNVTMIIHNARFMVEYDYENLKENPLTSYERHVIWRCKYLGITFEQLNKEEKEILKKYAAGPKILARVERYDAGIYIKDIKNVVAYNKKEETEILHKKEDKYEKNELTQVNNITKKIKEQEEKYVETEKNNKIRNQILSSVEIEENKEK
jgi:hypothetical protein